MNADINSLYIKRPDPVQTIKFTPTPNQIEHKPWEDKLAILVCQIKIWDAKGTDWFTIPSDTRPLIIRECESIEVTDSSKDLINKAVVRFPRGTVISLTSKRDKKVKTGTASDNTQTEQPLSTATNNGEFMTASTSVYKDDDVPTTSIAMNYDDKGLIEFNRTKTEAALLSTNDVAIGNRIEIRLGYAYSEGEFKRMNTTLDHSDMDVVFTGFITSISADTPLELECTNMAHILASISAPNIPFKDSLKISDFLGDNSTYNLLKDTGISLAKQSEGLDIYIRGGTISDNLTVADVLSAWGDGGILCMIETLSNGKAQLKVGQMFSVGMNGDDLPNNDKKYITYTGGDNTVKIIQTNWDVAEDKLTAKSSDKKYLAVEAHGTYTDVESGKKITKLLKLTVRKNPDVDDVDEEGFQVINAHEYAKQKVTQHRNGTMTNRRVKGRLQDRVDLDKYNVVTYFSTTPQVKKEQLVEEAKQYWAKYSPNGIKGSLSIFGDVMVRPSDIIGLIDPRRPERNGYYYVEAVHTTFGVNGYRRELTIPHKVTNFKGKVQII